MKIILIHNPGAGYEQPSRIRIIETLKKHGAEISYISSKDEDFESSFLSAEGEQVIVAGGDGTVHKVARLLIDKPMPMAIMPIGTANNVSMSLNAGKVSLDSTCWIEGELTPVDVGEVDINGQKRIFFESLGFGTLATMMHQYTIAKRIKKPNFENRREKLSYLYHLILKILPSLRPNDYHITVDQKKYDGSYLWVEVINMKYFGPHLSLAPKANLQDGALDMVLIREEEKPLLQQYFTSLLEGNEVEPGFRVVRGKRFYISTEEEPLHVDDVVWTKGKDIQPGTPFHLSIHARQNALSLVKYPLVMSEELPHPPG